MYIYYTSVTRAQSKVCNNIGHNSGMTNTSQSAVTMGHVKSSKRLSV